MKRQTVLSLTAAASLGLGSLTAIAPVAAGMFDFMSPGKWFDNDNDRYSGGRYGRYGYGGPYGWGGGPYGGGYGGPYGWGGGPYGGWGGPYGGGWGGYPGYGQGSTIVVTPQGGGDRSPAPRLPE